MIDIAILSTPVLTGLFLGEAAWIWQCLPGFEATEPLWLPEFDQDGTL